MIKVGIDVLQISRISEKVKNSEDFLNIILTDNEINYCKSKVGEVESDIKKYQSIAGIYSAKEAFYKALGTGIKSLEYFKMIEIDHYKSGQPFVKVLKEFDILTNCKEIALSISHDGDIATSICIIET